MKSGRVRCHRAGFLLVVYGLFLAFAVSPPAVWCHKPEGRVEIETESAPGLCRCEKCEFCREPWLSEILGRRADGTTLQRAHCTHEAVDSAVVRAEARANPKLELVLATENPAEGFIAAIQIAPSPPGPPYLASIFESPPGPPSILRC